MTVTQGTLLPVTVGYFTWKLDWNPWRLAYSASAVAYPEAELVSGGVSKSHKFKGLVKVGASKGFMRVDLKKNHGRGGSGQPETPWIRH